MVRAFRAYRQVQFFPRISLCHGYIEAAQLSDNFWNIGLVQNLETTSTTNPVFQVYLASQIFFKDTSLLSANVPVSELITLGGDIHHIFPKKFLIEHGMDKSKYNQEGNYAYLDRPVNESIGKKAPKDYFGLALQQCTTKQAIVGSIIDETELHRNLSAFLRMYLVWALAITIVSLRSGVN